LSEKRKILIVEKESLVNELLKERLSEVFTKHELLFCKSFNEAREIKPPKWHLVDAAIVAGQIGSEFGPDFIFNLKVARGCWEIPAFSFSGLSKSFLFASGREKYSGLFAGFFDKTEVKKLVERLKEFIF
jgi:hypothetical protein